MNRFEETAAGTAAGIIGAHVAIDAAQWWGSLPIGFQRILTRHMMHTILRTGVVFTALMFLAWIFPGDLGGLFGLAAFVVTPLYFGVRMSRRTDLANRMSATLQAQEQDRGQGPAGPPAQNWRWN